MCWKHSHFHYQGSFLNEISVEKKESVRGEGAVAAPKTDTCMLQHAVGWGALGDYLLDQVFSSRGGLLPESMAGADQEGSEEGVSPHGLTSSSSFVLSRICHLIWTLVSQTVQSVS